MRRVVLRGLVLVVSAVLAFGVFAGPRGEPRGAIARLVKKVRALGDLITVPTPAPTPKP